jgi:CMP-N-acetylneuraminic acid synthetase
MDLKTLAVIPARGGSKGLPDKNLKQLGGLSLIARAVLAAKSVQEIDEVIVTTDSTRIAEEASKFGARVPFLRQDALSGDLATTEETLKDALVTYESQCGIKFDLAVYFSPSEGFLDPECVSRGIRFLDANPTCESYFSGQANFKNYWEIQDGEFARLRSWMSVYSSRQIRKSILREDTGRGCVSRAELWRQGRRIGDKVEIEKATDPRINLDIHSALDLEVARITLEELGDLEIYKKTKS